jgi:hypothetical protein
MKKLTTILVLMLISIYSYSQVIDDFSKVSFRPRRVSQRGPCAAMQIK